MEKFVEIQNWGFNALIISSIMTMLFSIFQGYGFVKQFQKIWKDKSVKSISPPFFFLFFFYFIAFIFYGLSKGSLAIVFSGLLFTVCIPIVVGIIKFGKLKLIDWLSFSFSAAIVPIMILIKQKEIFIFILLLVSLAVLVSQLVTIIKEKTSGSVEIKLMIVLFVSSVFWFGYACFIKDWALQIFNFSAAFIYLCILLLYRKYSKGRYKITCHDCDVKIGEFHEPNCDWEECPFCHQQLIDCGCCYDELGIDPEKEPTYSQGLTDEQGEKWDQILREKGLVPYGKEKKFNKPFYEKLKKTVVFELVSDAFAYWTDPEARMLSKFKYPSGAGMSVRCAKKLGLM